ncbi:MAG TPA: glycosyltransferase, partial [Candidatus Andersenbacteria bacterium]|nr:glycosyltransferase [Candidatus Andersenbacteria bacterium]
IHTSSLQQWPRWFRRHPGRMLPFLPQAAEQFDLSTYDIVISSSSGFSKGVITRSTIPHLCYCHTPTRYIWDASLRVVDQRSFVRPILRMLFHWLRMIDFAAAQRPTAYIANSHYTQQKIKTYYQKDSSVVYPPIDTNFFTPRSTSSAREYFLCVGRLTPEKKFDHAILVAEKLGLQLVIAGVGSDKSRLQKLAGKHTRFAENVSREELRDLYRNARALIQPGIEDFGMTAAEALACGTPVIAFGMGGVVEIVRNGVHGILYREQLPETLAEAIRNFIRIERAFYPENLQKQASAFSVDRFRQGIAKEVEHLLQVRNT